MAKYICFLLSCALLIGCGQSKDRHIPDSGAQLQSNPFDTDNKELLFAQIDTAVDSAFKATEIDYQAHTLKGYLAWDSVTRALYSPDLLTHSSDSDWAKHQNGIIEYLNWHLRKSINSLLSDERIVEALKTETALTDSLLVSQYKWLRTHFDTTQQALGTTCNLKYYNIENEILELQNKNLRELLEALTDSNYSRTVPHKISPELLVKEYHHIKTAKIPYYHNDSVYNAKIDRLNFNTEIEAWNRLITQRNNISSMLNGTVRTAFDIGTYRLMFNRLRQLKNEYEAYDSMSEDMRNNVLSDSCTYEELLAYPNFSTKWNEYLKQFE